MARERFRLASAVPPATRGEHEIGAIVPRVLKRLGLADRAWLEQMSAEWPTLVGNTVAGHCRPGRYADGMLTVFVDSSAWLNELERFSKTELLRNVQNRFGKGRVRHLLLQLDPDGSGQGRGAR